MYHRAVDVRYILVSVLTMRQGSATLLFFGGLDLEIVVGGLFEFGGAVVFVLEFGVFDGDAGVTGGDGLGERRRWR